MCDDSFTEAVGRREGQGVGVYLGEEIRHEYILQHVEMGQFLPSDSCVQHVFINCTCVGDGRHW